MFNKFLRNRGAIAPLFLILFALTVNCTPNENRKAGLFGELEPTESRERIDTVLIKVKSNQGVSTGLNFYDEFLENEFLEFKNNRATDTVIYRNFINKPSRHQIFTNYYLTKELGEVKMNSDHFFLKKGTKLVEMNHTEGLILNASDSESGYFEIDSNLVSEYQNFDIKKDEKALLSLIHKKYLNKYSEKEDFKSTYHKRINDYFYFDNLQKIEPKNLEADSFLMSEDDPINGQILSSLLYHHVKNRIYDFNYSSLTKENYTANYIDLLSLGVFRFLLKDENKGESRYDQAKKWLSTTTWYSEHKDFVEKAISPVDNITFKNLLKTLNLMDTSLHKRSLEQIIAKNPSSYYLIDFWATWCKPCIEGIKIMAEKDIPEHVSVISLSLDKSNKIEKWKEMTLKLNQRITYLVSEDESLKKFVDVMQLQSIPRYVIIDKEMNIIDESFLAPHHPDFIKELKALR